MLTFLEHRRIGDRPVRRTFIPADRPGDGKHGEYNFFGTCVVSSVLSVVDFLLVSTREQEYTCLLICTTLPCSTIRKQTVSATLSHDPVQLFTAAKQRRPITNSGYKIILHQQIHDCDTWVRTNSQYIIFKELILLGVCVYMQQITLPFLHNNILGL
jgi:hypothetical protein